MVSESVEVDHVAASLGEADASCGADTSELSAETYEKLRRLAAEYLRSERAGHTLQPTALLHEAFLRVLKQPDHSWRDEAHVIAFAARAMRRILISYGVARTRDKRGGSSAVRLPLDEALDFCVERDLNIGAVDEALEELEVRVETVDDVADTNRPAALEAIDAMTDLKAETHENSVRHIFPRLGETGTTEDIIGLLDLRSESARMKLLARLCRAALKRLDFIDRAQARARARDPAARARGRRQVRSWSTWCRAVRHVSILDWQSRDKLLQRCAVPV